MTKKIIIAIDPGHGGKDPGAISKKGRMMEKKINLNVALKLREKLEAKGFEVVMTRDADEELGLTARGKFANENKADFMVSIHHNSAAVSTAKGFDVIYEGNTATHAESFKMAQLLAAEYKQMGQSQHKVFCKMGTKNPAQDWYTILYSSKVPTIISEYCFLSTVTDEEKVDTLTEQWNEAAAIARAICKYFGV